MDRGIMDQAGASGLTIAPALFDFVNSEAIPGTGVGPTAFWAGFAALIGELGPRCAVLLAKRDSLQTAIDAWHLQQRGKPFDHDINRHLIFHLDPDPEKVLQI